MAHSNVAVITGGGRGMGAGIARALHARGYCVALMSPSGSAQALAAELGGIGVSGSVTSPDDLARLVDLTLSRWGRIDALVNNAGGPQKGDIMEVADADWYDGFELLLMGPVRMTRLVTPVMQRQGGGAIVNITSYAVIQPVANLGISSVLRSGISTFTKLYADRHAVDGIRMNSILPGYIDSIDFPHGTPDPIPMGRIGRVSEIAATAAFLLSEDAGYITGQNIRVDGGVTRVP